MPPPKDPEKYKLWKERVDAAAAKRKGVPLSKEHKIKMSESRIKNPVAFWKGKSIPQKTRDKMSNSHKGQVPWNKNVPSTEEAKQNQINALKNKPKPPRTKEHCENISKSKTGDKNPMFGKHHSDDARVKMHNAQLGNKKKLGYRFPSSTRERMSRERLIKHALMNYVYITPLAKAIRESFKYREWVIAVFERDDYTCQQCKIRGGYLEAHHIKLFSTILKENKITTLQEAFDCKELWNINNGMTLHHDCHKKEHKNMRLIKKNNNK